MDAFELLQKRMDRAKDYERPGILLGAYKQLVVSNNEHQNRGEYREYAERSPDNLVRIGEYTYRKLKRYGMDNSAERLADQLLGDGLDE
ncbi:MAG: hypothetical protein V1813_03370 [Candidatus Aenigmatarchaeota archaeon]